MNNMVTEELIKSKIKNVTYTRIQDTTVTICNLILENGFSVRGESACVDHDNFDEKIGETLAYENAFNKIWQLEGYLMKQRMSENQNKVEQIAKACHEINRAYCESIGDYSQQPWEKAPDWVKESALNGVRKHLAQPMTPEQSHQAWLNEKKATGWEYGPVKDTSRKIHPCMVPFSMLPPDQRTKDFLFGAVVEIMRG